MKEHTGIEHIAQMRYILGLFAVNQNTIFTNTIDYAKKILKIQVTRENLEQGKVDIVPNILFARKILHLFFEYCKRLAKKMKDYTALPVIGFNYYTDEESNTVEISQNHITRNKNRSWIFVTEKFLDRENMILANTIEVVPIWKKKKRFYTMEKHAFERSFGPAPISVDMDIYELDGATEVIFNNYLVEKEGLHNTLLRSPQQYIQEDNQFIFIYKELNDWAGKGIRIQEPDRCISDIIEVNYKEKFDSNKYPPIPMADDNSNRDTSS
jgi:hypothetical protein